MPKADSLFSLIFSLDKSERRYFKIHASKRTNKLDSCYLEMYDIISKQKEYDEIKLISILNNPTFTKNLAQNKKYLKDLILKSLCEKSEQTPRDLVNNLIKEYKVLMNKMLHKEMFKKLQKAKEIAVKYELFDLNILIRENEIIRLLNIDFNKSQLIKSDYIQSKELLVYKRNMYDNLRTSLLKVYSVMIKQNKKATTEQLDLIQNEFDLYNRAEILALDSFYISRSYFQILDSYYAIKNDFENNVKTTFFIYNMFVEDFQHFKEPENDLYVMSYYNYISALFRAGKFKLLFDALSKSTTFKLKSDKTKLTFFIKTTSNWLSYYLNTGKIDEAFILEAQFEVVYKKDYSKIDKVDLISIFYNFSLIYFFNKKFEKCLIWLARLELLKKQQRTDIFTDAYIINIICNFELNNYSVLESLVRSQRSRSGIMEIEHLIINSVLKSSKNSLKEKQVFQKLAIDLQKLQHNYLSVDWTTMNLWLDSKIKNQSLQKLYQKEVLENG